MYQVELIAPLLFGMILSVKTLVLSGQHAMQSLLRRPRAAITIKHVHDNSKRATAMTDVAFRRVNTRLYSTDTNTYEDAPLDTPDTMPSSFKSPFMQTMLERGFIHQCTDFQALDEKFVSEKVTAYLGFDATANSLHVGSLLQVWRARSTQRLHILCSTYMFYSYVFCD